ncbi:MAG: helix-turn-helix domain-containing protein [Bacteroidota bacterium]
MEIQLEQASELQQIKETLEAMKNFMLITEKDKLKKELLNNEEMMKFLDVSKRTLQHYRDNGMLSFIQIKGKIYYKYEDIQEFLNANRNKAFKK